MTGLATFAKFLEVSVADADLMIPTHGVSMMNSDLLRGAVVSNCRKLYLDFV